MDNFTVTKVVREGYRRDVYKVEKIIMLSFLPSPPLSLELLSSLVCKFKEYDSFGFSISFSYEILI